MVYSAGPPALSRSVGKLPPLEPMTRDLGEAPPPKTPADASLNVDSNLKVALRCRPPSPAELQRGGAASRLQVDVPNQRVQVVADPQKPGDKQQEFAFDWVYSEEASQQQVYEDLGAPAVDSAFKWFNSTVFAYGQTGSGKTHSMLGEEDDARHHGLIRRVVAGVFARLADARRESAATLADGLTTELVVRCSYIEIYQEVLVDLLVQGNQRPIDAGDRLKIRSDPNLGVYVQGATEAQVESVEEVMALMRAGSARRRVGAHSLNERSSRSHALFTLKLLQVYNADGRRIPKRIAKINLVDLAGSERQKETHAEGVRLQESAAINKSLHTLQRVLKALTQAQHRAAQERDQPDQALLARLGLRQEAKNPAIVPFRESKLTRLLEESLGGGGAFCCMLACVAGSDAFLTQTLSTLKYAAAARTIRAVVRRNQDITESDALRSEVESLRKQLAHQRQAQGSHAEAAAKKKINALMCILEQTSHEQQARLAAAEEERRAAAAQLPLPARAALALRKLGAAAAPKLQGLQAEVARAEAGFHQQRRFLVSLEEALKVELNEAAGPSQQAAPDDLAERLLERIQVRLRTVQAESRSLGEKKKQICSLYENMAALASAERGRLQAHLQLTATPPSSARAPPPGEVEDQVLLEDEAPARGGRWGAGGEEGASSDDEVEGAAAEEAPAQRPEEEVVGLLQEVEAYCRTGIDAVRRGGPPGGAPTQVPDREGIPMMLLMAFVEELPDPAGAREGREMGSLRRGAGGSGGSGLQLSDSMQAARLAWGDTKAIDCAGFALERIEAALQAALQRKQVEMQTLLAERQQLREAVFRLEKAAELREAELQEANQGAEEAFDSLEAAHQELARTQRLLTLQGRQAAAHMQELEEAASEARRERQAEAAAHEAAAHEAALGTQRAEMELQRERHLREALEQEVHEWRRQAEMAQQGAAAGAQAAGMEEAALKSQLHSYQVQAEAAQAAHQGAVAQVADLQRDLAACQAERDAHASSLAVQAARGDGLQRELQAAEEQLREVERQAGRQVVELSTVQEERAALAKEAARMEEAAEALKSKALQSEKERAEREVEASALQAHLHGLRQVDVRTGEELDKLREELAETKGLKAAGEREVDRLSDKVTRVEQMIEDKEKEYRDTLTELHVEKENAARLKGELQKALEPKSKACIIM